MKKIILLLFCFSNHCFSQNLKLKELVSICSKENWESVNQIMMNKGWVYYDSQKGNEENYSTITWSYNKDRYDDKATGWFYLYTYEGYPNKISYSVFNKEAYSLIQNAISANGFKLIKSDIENNEIISTYSSESYMLIISTTKTESSKWDSSSLTAYSISLIKKSGIYDHENGKKFDYYDNNIVKAEYTLAEGKLHGELKVFYENGKIKKQGLYINGSANGKFIEYDIEGNKISEYILKNDKREGKFSGYENGHISFSTTFKNDLLDGPHIEYFYRDNDDLYLKLQGQYLNDKKEGKWCLFYLKNEESVLMTTENYTMGEKNGLFQDIRGDSLVVGNYKNNLFDGETKIYRDVNNILLGNVFTPDTTKLVLVSKGTYSNGLKNGLWKNYDLAKTLISEGRYLNDLKNGVWKYYYSQWSDENGEIAQYTGELHLVETYKNGELDGESERYSYLNEVPCSKKIDDDCVMIEYEKVQEKLNYKRGLLNGPFEQKDILNKIVIKGNFLNGLKEGEWFFSNKENHSSYQKGIYHLDKKEGEWVKYLENGRKIETINYVNGSLNGYNIIWNNNERFKELVFDNNRLKTFTKYDSIEHNKPILKYEILVENTFDFRCNKIEYFDYGYSIQEFWVKKEEETLPYDIFDLYFFIYTSDSSKNNIDAYKDGSYYLYNNTNEPLVKGYYKKNQKIGKWTFTYYDQKVNIDINYEADNIVDEKYLDLNGELFSGEFVFINKEKDIKEIRKIKKGLRNGKTTYIDLQTNSILKKEKYKDSIMKEI